jgi:dTDP-4-dehydrorhamnose reductase
VIKISIIGASGFIGYRLYKYLIRFNNFEVQGTYNLNKKNLYLKKVDITDKKNLQNYLLQETPDFILWLSGCKDIKKCEDDYNFAYGVNTKPIEDLVSIIYQSKISTKVLFFSTNYVFEGIDGNYQDNDKQNPKTNYGKTKALAENILRESLLDYKIIRTSTVMGRGGTFFDWLLKVINEGKEIKLYSNIYFTPTPLEFLNENIKNIIDNFDKIESKIIHLVGEKRLSKYEFSVKLAKLIKQENIKFYPQEVNLESPWIQRDLSLLQSNLVKRNQVKYFWDYMEKEVKDDTNS